MNGLTFLLAWGALDAAGGAEPRLLRLVENTGHVIILHQDDAWLGGKDAALPTDIPSGSEVYVLTGRATFRGCGIVVRATEGDDFTYDVRPEQDCDRSIQLAARGELAAVDVDVGDVHAMLADGEALSVSSVGRGLYEVRVLAGWVIFTTPEGDRHLAPGGTLFARGPVQAPLQPRARARPPAPAPTPVPSPIPLTEAELRSAPGPKPQPPLLPMLAVATGSLAALELYVRWRARSRRRRR
ncbi:MAG: hypothetical protein HY553_07240 [Elusimicrobia bacterium]|nr:hypothetical protein [Elusimicrobiota bacterium]